MPETQTAHFWVGRFTDEQAVCSYFVEVWDESDPDRVRTPLSRFAADQGEKWYDHDFLEYGFHPNPTSLQELVAGYSYSEQWTEEFVARANAIGLSEFNAFVFINVDEIDRPRTVIGSGYSLHYLGSMTYRI